MKKLLLLITLLLVAMLAFAGCAGDDDENGNGDDTQIEEPTDADNEVDDTADDPATDDEDDEPDDETAFDIPDEDINPLAAEIMAGVNAVLARFPSNFNDGGTHVEGATLMYGIGSPTPWLGIIGGAVFSTSAICAEIAGFIGTGSSILSATPDYTMGQEGIANFEMDLENSRFIFNMQEYVYWHDGTPLTLADLAFAYYVLAHPEYGGVRFSTGERMVTGIMDFHNGYTDYISGIQLSNNDRTLTIYFDQISPDFLNFGIWTAPMPRHIFEDIPVAEMAYSPYVRETPVGWGPFILADVVPGESVYLTRNENYVWGTPYIESVIIRRFAPELVGTHMEAGDFDVVSFGTAFYADYADPTNFRFLASIDEGYQHMSFRLGHFDMDTWQNVYSPGRNMGNPALRRAMAFAIDENALGEYVFNGLHFQAASFMTPNHVDLMDFNVPIFNYDPDRARQILDDAGFTELDDDGYRMHPDGTPLTVTWAFSTGPLEEILVPFYIQAWAAVGIRVELWRGMTHDIFYLWDVLDYDDDNDEIDIYMAQWTNIWNPEPSGRWGHDLWNPSRYNSPEWEAIQARLISQDALASREYMRDAYSAMQWYMYEQAFAIPLRWTTSLVAVNNRVSRWDTRVGIPPSEIGWHLVRLTEAEPVRR